MTAIVHHLRHGSAMPGKLRLARTHQATAMRALTRVNVELRVVISTDRANEEGIRSTDDLQRAIPAGCRVVHARYNAPQHQHEALLHASAAVARTAKWPSWMRVVSEVKR